MSSVFRFFLEPLFQIHACACDGFRRFASHEAIKMASLSTKAMFVLALVLVVDIGAVCAQVSALEETWKEREIYL